MFSVPFTSRKDEHKYPDPNIALSLERLTKSHSRLSLELHEDTKIQLDTLSYQEHTEYVSSWADYFAGGSVLVDSGTFEER